MWRKLLLLAVLAAGTISLTSCNLGDSSCTAPSRTQTGGGGGAGSRAVPSVCGASTTDNGSAGPSCTNTAGFTHFLYLADTSGRAIKTYGLGQDGHSELLCSAITQDYVTSILVAQNKFLYAYSSISGRVTAYQVAGPMFTPVANSPYTSGTNWGAAENRTPLSTDATGRFLFVPNSDSISVFAIDATSGALTPVTGSPFQSAFSGIVSGVRPKGDFFYNLSDPSTLRQFAVDPAGVLTPLSNPLVTYVSPTVLGGQLRQMRFDSAGKFLYVGYGRTVSLYRIDGTTGELTWASDATAVPYPNDTAYPFAFDLEAGGRYLYVSNPTSAGMPSVNAYAIDASTGVMAPIAGQPFSSGTESSYRLIADPAWPRLWVLTGVEGSIQILGLAIDPTTGALSVPTTTTTHYAVSYGPTAIAVIQ